MKRKISLTLLAVLLLFLAVNWFYPYSFLSMNKSYSYNQDNVSGKYFLAEHKKAKQFVLKQEPDHISKIVSYFYEDIDQTYVMELGQQTIKQSDLVPLYFMIKEHKRNFLSLFVQPGVTISPETKFDLVYVINALDTIEDQLNDLTHPHFYTRQQTRGLIRNILVEIDYTCESVDSFYKTYIKENG